MLEIQIHSLINDTLYKSDTIIIMKTDTIKSADTITREIRVIDTIKTNINIRDTIRDTIIRTISVHDTITKSLEIQLLNQYLSMILFIEQSQ